MPVRYEEDTAKWLEEQIAFLRQRKFDNLDIDHIIEEMEDLPGQKNAIFSLLRNIMLHMLKIKYDGNPECVRVWQISIDTPRADLEQILENNPGWQQHVVKVFPEAYEKARSLALRKIKKDIPIKCPWSIEKVLGVKE